MHRRISAAKVLRAPTVHILSVRWNIGDRRIAKLLKHIIKDSSQTNCLHL